MSELRIDGLQYCTWTEAIFREMRKGGVAAVHATVSYHGGFAETARNIAEWEARFAAHPSLIVPGLTAGDVRQAHANGRTAILLGLQNPSPVEDDIDNIERLFDIGIRFMQLTYNNQSLLAGGCAEAEDAGLTRMGREAVKEMNRLGMVIDLSHTAERSSLEAIGASDRPVAVTHANPSWWRPGPRNKSEKVLKALAGTRGILGFSLYPLHLKDGSSCTLESFCEMAARTAELMGDDCIGIGSDLCQGRTAQDLDWMRRGRWTKAAPDGDDFPPQPPWFRSNLDFGNIEAGLRKAGFDDMGVRKVMGENWLSFFKRSFG